MDLHCGASPRQDLVLEEDVGSRAVVSIENSQHCLHALTSS